MAVPTRPPRTRASGGRTLMLLGVLLALAAGTIVIYIVSQATGVSGNATVTVVVAKVTIPEGTVLTVSTPDATHTLISDAFQVKQVPQDLVPPNAFQYVSQDDLNVKLTDEVVVGQFYQGDILQQGDPRLVKQGTGAVGSLLNINPGRIPAGDVLFGLELSGQSGGKPAAVAGDYVDIIAIVCNLPNSKDPQGCESQTTAQNLYVYTVVGNTIFTVVDRTTAQELLLLTKQTSTQYEIAIRDPKDQSHHDQDPVDNGTLVKAFSF